MSKEESDRIQFINYYFHKAQQSYTNKRIKLSHRKGYQIKEYNAKVFKVYVPL